MNRNRLSFTAILRCRRAAALLLCCALLLSACPGLAGGFDHYTRYGNAYGVLNRKMATRTGPGTQYDEPGTFPKTTSIRAISKVWDTRNEIWWIQVRFTYNGADYTAYTGLKRIDGLNLSSLPTESVIGRCTTRRPVEAFYAPSENAARIRRDVPAGAVCTIYGYVYGPYGDYIQIEFYDYGIQKWRRAGVKDWAVDDYYMY